jgi:hypothetical protein
VVLLAACVDGHSGTQTGSGTPATLTLEQRQAVQRQLAALAAQTPATGPAAASDAAIAALVGQARAAAAVRLLNELGCGAPGEDCGAD